jgi:hypothetical protein
MLNESGIALFNIIHNLPLPNLCNHNLTNRSGSSLLTGITGEKSNPHLSQNSPT